MRRSFLLFALLCAACCSEPPAPSSPAEAIRSRNLEALQQILAAGADPQASDYNGTPLLHLAVDRGHQPIVELLLDAGTEVDARDADSGKTPLFAAAVNGEVQKVELLVRRGADVNAKTSHLRTPLHDAAWSGKAEVVRYLLTAGADADPKDGFAYSPLDFANQQGHAEVARLLEEAGGTTRPADAEPIESIGASAGP